jgi:hypothetical protein
MAKISVPRKPRRKRSKRIGIFTKMDMAGGSEFRAVEMANAISRVEGYCGVLLAEKSIPDRLRKAIEAGVEVHEGVFTKPDVEALYSVDHLLVINTDSRDFTTAAYWDGRTGVHAYKVNLGQIRQLVFLFNFIVSPSCHLPELRELVPDIRIITANSKFFDEISEQARYEEVRHYPRLQLESPISLGVAKPKTHAPRLRFGMHSLPNADKWNSQFPELVRAVNEKWGDQVVWDFMGMPGSLRRKITGPNVILRPEFCVPVDEFLTGLDVFVFFVSWRREEAWARSVGEALMSGCPVITTGRGGNRNQVIHGNTGYLCKTVERFVESCGKLIETKQLLTDMRRNAASFARNFASEKVAERFLAFVQ